MIKTIRAKRQCVRCSSTKVLKLSANDSELGYWFCLSCDHKWLACPLCRSAWLEDSFKLGGGGHQIFSGQMKCRECGYTTRFDEE